MLDDHFRRLLRNYGLYTLGLLAFIGIVAMLEREGLPREVIGYVFTAVSTGKSAGLVVMTGVDASGTVTGVAVTEDSETAGYIAKVTDGGLFETLKGRQNTDGVDTVSQATKTSKGILKGVDKALEYFAQIG